MATTRSRSRQRSAEIKRFSLSLSIISRMASTWPCGRDFCVVNRSCGETRGSSRSTRRKVSILSGGQSERVATVRLRVCWPSRQASRRRTAGGELRLGTTSMYMGALDHNNYTLSSINMINYMGAYWRSRDGTMHTFPAVYPRIQPLLLLELRFKEDNLQDILPLSSYATTLRRKLIDLAAKVVRTGHEVILKVTQAAMDSLKLQILSTRCQNVVPIPLPS